MQHTEKELERKWKLFAVITQAIIENWFQRKLTIIAGILRVSEALNNPSELEVSTLGAGNEGEASSSTTTQPKIGRGEVPTDKVQKSLLQLALFRVTLPLGPKRAEGVLNELEQNCFVGNIDWKALEQIIKVCIEQNSGQLNKFYKNMKELEKVRK